MIGNKITIKVSMMNVDRLSNSFKMTASITRMKYWVALETKWKSKKSEIKFTGRDMKTLLDKLWWEELNNMNQNIRWCKL